MKTLLLFVMLCSCLLVSHQETRTKKPLDNLMESSDFPTTPLLMIH